jgi:tetratricopeptide (TPR) repeat protein
MTGSVGKQLPAKNAAKVISESSLAPGQPSRFQRKRPEFSKGPGERSLGLGGNQGSSNAAMSEIDFCEQLLTGGFVQSYVDFFHLTHRNDPTVVDPTHTGQKIHVSLKDMIFIRDNLVMAEAERRQGNTSGVYAAFNRLADFYETQQADYPTSIFFHEKCLDVATMTSDVRAEMAANHALGCVYQKLRNNSAAARHHEQHEALASSLEVFDEVVRASSQLYRVYTLLAEEALAAEGDADANAESALLLYQRSLAAASKSMDKASEGEANAKIGMLLLRMGRTEESVKFLRQQSQIAADNGNPESRCRACSALALAYDALGQADKALAELMLVSTISEQAGDVMLQSQANRALGTLYSKVGKLQESVAALTRHFSLLKGILAKKAEIEAAAHLTGRDLDLARVYVGVAKGNLQMGSVLLSIQFDFNALLNWKLSRAALPLPEVLRPATLLERVVQEEDAAVAAMVAAEEKAA